MSVQIKHIKFKPTSWITWRYFRRCRCFHIYIYCSIIGKLLQNMTDLYVTVKYNNPGIHPLQFHKIFNQKSGLFFYLENINLKCACVCFYVNLIEYWRCIYMVVLLRWLPLPFFNLTLLEWSMYKVNVRYKWSGSH